MHDKIDSLKNFVKAYGSKKSDVEISYMLDIPVDEVKSQRKEISHKDMEKKMNIHRDHH